MIVTEDHRPIRASAPSLDYSSLCGLNFSALWNLMEGMVDVAETRLAFVVGPNRPAQSSIHQGRVGRASRVMRTDQSETS